jgi:integrin beta 3
VRPGGPAQRPGTGGGGSLDRGNTGAARVPAASGAIAVPQRVDAPIVGARAGAAKAAEGLTETSTRLGGEIREKMRTQRRLRLVTLLSLAIVVLVVLPAVFGLRSLSSDPVFSSLNSLSLPSWASQKVQDQSSGSRWCFLDCTFRERTAQSQKPFKETTAAYSSALTTAGWQPWKVAECPEQEIDAKSGTYTCWTRDEFTLDLSVGLPACAVDQIAAQDPALAGTTPPAPLKNCDGSTVSIKVRNAISDTRGEPQPKESPLVGETPDPVISDDPLLQPTPAAS